MNVAHCLCWTLYKHETGCPANRRQFEPKGDARNSGLNPSWFHLYFLETTLSNILFESEIVSLRQHFSSTPQHTAVRCLHSARRPIPPTWTLPAAPRRAAPLHLCVTPSTRRRDLLVPVFAAFAGSPTRTLVCSPHQVTRAPPNDPSPTFVCIAHDLLTITLPTPTRPPRRGTSSAPFGRRPSDWFVFHPVFRAIYRRLILLSFVFGPAGAVSSASSVTLRGGRGRAPPPTRPPRVSRR